MGKVPRDPVDADPFDDSVDLMPPSRALGLFLVVHDPVLDLSGPSSKVRCARKGAIYPIIQARAGWIGEDDANGRLDLLEVSRNAGESAPRSGASDKAVSHATKSLKVLGDRIARVDPPAGLSPNLRAGAGKVRVVVGQILRKTGQDAMQRAQAWRPTSNWSAKNPRGRFSKTSQFFEVLSPR